MDKRDNPVIRAILDRRSVRAFTTQPVPEETRDLIVEAGLYAPSSKNAQAWHVTVVENRDRIGRITAEVKAAIIRRNVQKYLGVANNPNYQAGYGAPVFMIVSANPGVTSCPVEDCACLLENMFLAAHALGISSCWINQLGPVCDDEAFRALLTETGVPVENKVYGCAAFGYNAGEAPRAPARKDGTVNLVR